MGGGPIFHSGPSFVRVRYIYYFNSFEYQKQGQLKLISLVHSWALTCSLAINRLEKSEFMCVHSFNIEPTLYFVCTYVYNGCVHMLPKVYYAARLRAWHSKDGGSLSRWSKILRKYDNSHHVYVSLLATWLAAANSIYSINTRMHAGTIWDVNSIHHIAMSILIMSLYSLYRVVHPTVLH